RIPPGFNDAQIGDFRIWKVILHVGTERKKSVIFVSGEEKNDWVRKSGDTIIAPRYELIDEYRRASGNQGFYVLSLAELLKLFGASEDSIREVQATDRAAAEEAA